MICHYFPQWHQKFWCDEKNLCWCFIKATSKVEHLHPKKIGAIEDLYISATLDLESTLMQYFDNTFSDLVYHICAAIHSWVEENGELSNLQHRYRSAFSEVCIHDLLAQYWMSSLLRHPTCFENKSLRLTQYNDANVDLWSLSRTLLQGFVRFVVYYNRPLVVTSDNNIIIDDDLIIMPLSPYLLWVASKKPDHTDLKKTVAVNDWDLLATNYICQVEGANNVVIFPYEIYAPTKAVVDELITKRELPKSQTYKYLGSPCAIDLVAGQVVWSNYSGDHDLFQNSIC